MSELGIAVDWAQPQWTMASVLLCGHAVGDFWLQTRRMVEAKRSSWRIVLIHSIVVAVVQAAFIACAFNRGKPCLVAVTILLTHFPIDLLKRTLDQRFESKRLWWFLTDQVMHLMVLGWLWENISADPVRGSLAYLVGPAAIVIAVVAFNCSGASSVVNCILASVSEGQSEDHRAKNDEGTSGGGRLIGILERMLVLTFVAAGQWEAVGFVITAKSIARFKRLDKQVFAETYLIGTMSSVLIAIAGGLLIRIGIQLPPS